MKLKDAFLKLKTKMITKMVKLKTKII